MWVSLAVSLLLTLLLELPIALGWGLRGRRLLLCALVNLLTNPVVVLLCLLFPALWVTALSETGAVLAEGWYYRRYGVERPWLLSLCANGCSFGAGVLLQLLF